MKKQHQLVQLMLDHFEFAHDPTQSDGVREVYVRLAPDGAQLELVIFGGFALYRNKKHLGDREDLIRIWNLIVETLKVTKKHA